MIKNILKGILPGWVIEKLGDVKRAAAGNPVISYAQEGEDVLLFDYFSEKQGGFYIDVGAYHPKVFSNTYLFYKNGWTGINIDATPGSMKLFRKYRPRDINIEQAISDTERTLTFCMFDIGAFNCFRSESTPAPEGAAETGRVELKTATLESVLSAHIQPGTPIDFLNIDTEGFELNVLKSNNWEAYRPKVIAVEIRERDMHNLKEDPTAAFLLQEHYSPIAQTRRTVIFEDRAQNE